MFASNIGHRPRSSEGKNKEVTLDQVQSPLFQVPAEIRNRIFQLALTASPDPKRPYHPSDTWYRPGFHAYPKVYTGLLLTCRRIHSETRLFPILANDHVFWYGNGRAPQNLKHASDTVAYFAALTSEEQAHVKSIWWFAQQCTMEGGNYSRPCQIFRILPDPQFKPEKMKITIRLSDWWGWENRNSLSVNPLFSLGWKEQFRHVPDLQTFVLEMEMVEERKLELDLIIEKLGHLRIPLGKSTWLHPRQELTNYEWNGPEAYLGTRANGRGRIRFPPQPDDAKTTKSDPLSNTKYYVVSMVWKATELPNGTTPRSVVLGVAACDISFGSSAI